MGRCHVAGCFSLQRCTCQELAGKPDISSLCPLLSGARMKQMLPPPPPVALVNGTIVLPESTVVGQALYLLDGRIHAICAVDDLPSDVLRIDVQDRTITPGLV